MKLLTDFSSADPTRLAAVSPTERITYAQFEDDIAALSYWLLQQGLAKGTRIGVCMKEFYWNWVGHLAALRAGLIVASARQTSALSMVSVGRLQFILSSFPAETTLPAGLTWLVAPATADIAGRQKADEALSANANRLVATSGTTGSVRLVSWDAEATYLRIAQVAKTLSTETVLYTPTMIEATGGFRYPLATWMAGGTVVFGSMTRDAELVLPQDPVTTDMLVTPQTLGELLRRIPGVWPGKEKRRIVAGGSRMPANVREQALERACGKLIMTYGATETGSIASGDSELLSRHPGAVGFIRPGNEVQIVDADDKAVPAGTAGTVRVRTPYMTHGYETAQGLEPATSFRDGWFYPGDEGVLSEDGFFAIEGRASDVLNIGAHKMHVSNVETKLEGLPGVRDYCALVMKLDDTDRLAILLVCERGVDLEDIQRRISKVLPAHIPFSLVRVKEIERNAMGKVPRRALAEKIAVKYQEKKAS